MTSHILHLTAMIPLSVLLFTAADNLPAPPVAKKIPHVTQINGRTLTDNYFWLRDKPNPEVPRLSRRRERLHRRGDEAHRAASRKSCMTRC